MGSLGISNFLEEISSLSHSVIFLYFFALIAEESFLISPSYSLELCIQMLISFLFSLKEQSRRSWERFWEPSAYLTKCANSGSKDAFCRAMSSPCVILRPALLCCSALLTTPDTQLTEWHTCLLCGRHTLGPGRCQGDEGRWGSLSLPSGWQWRVNTWTTKWDDFVRYFWGQSYHIPKYTSKPFSSLENCHRYHFILANTISQLISLSLLPPSSPSTTAGLGKSFWKHKSIVDIPLLQSSP